MRSICRSNFADFDSNFLPDRFVANCSVHPGAFTPIAVATALSVTPAQATSASSIISAEQARLPSPPVAGCRPASVSPAQERTRPAIRSTSRMASARAGVSAVAGPDIASSAAPAARAVHSRP